MYLTPTLVKYDSSWRPLSHWHGLDFWREEKYRREYSLCWYLLRLYVLALALIWWPWKCKIQQIDGEMPMNEFGFINCLRFLFFLVSGWFFWYHYSGEISTGWWQVHILSNLPGPQFKYDHAQNVDLRCLLSFLCTWFGGDLALHASDQNAVWCFCLVLSGILDLLGQLKISSKHHRKDIGHWAQIFYQRPH